VDKENQMNIETVYKCAFCSESYNDQKTCEQHEYQVHFRPFIKAISKYCKDRLKDMTPFMDCPCKGCHFGVPAKYVDVVPLSEREEYICALKATPRNWIDSDE
jgi:hypothetical protein